MPLPTPSSPFPAWPSSAQSLGREVMMRSRQGQGPGFVLQWFWHVTPGVPNR